MKLSSLSLSAALTCSVFASSIAHGSDIEQVQLSNVKSNYRTMNLSDEAKSFGVVFAQAVTTREEDPGQMRINGNFKVKYQESTNGSHDTGEKVDVMALLTDLSSMGVTGEAGTFTMGTPGQNGTYSLMFQNEYENPVVFVQVASSQHSDPVSVFPMATGATGALIVMSEPADFDGQHGAETVNYMVVESGIYELSQGRYMEVGVHEITTDENYDDSSMQLIDPDVPFNSDAVLYAQGQDAATYFYRHTRVRKNIDANGILNDFYVRHMRDQEIEDLGDWSVTGFIGYVIVGDYNDASGIYVNIDEDAIQSVTLPFLDLDDIVVYYDEQPSASEIEDSCLAGNGLGEWLETPNAWFGNNRFGAGYNSQIGITNQAGDGDDSWIGATFDAEVTLVGTSLSVLDAGAEAAAEDNVQSNRGWLEILGVTLYDESIAAGVEWSESATFLSSSAYFYGVKVTASAGGYVGVEGNATVGATGISVDATPNAGITASASASIGAACASAGIEGTLTLIGVELPMLGNLTLNGSTVGFDVEASVALTTLSGSVDLVIDYCVDSRTKELFSMSGSTSSTTLISEAGCL